MQQISTSLLINKEYVLMPAGNEMHLLLNITTGSSYTGYVCVIQSLLNQFYYHTGNRAYYVKTVFKNRLGCSI